MPILSRIYYYISLGMFLLLLPHKYPIIDKMKKAAAYHVSRSAVKKTQKANSGIDTSKQSIPNNANSRGFFSKIRTFKSSLFLIGPVHPKLCQEVVNYFFYINVRIMIRLAAIKKYWLLTLSLLHFIL